MDLEASIQRDINLCACGCSGGLRPPSSIGDRRYNPGAPGTPRRGNAQELMSPCIAVGKGTLVVPAAHGADLERLSRPGKGRTAPANRGRAMRGRLLDRSQMLCADVVMLSARHSINGRQWTQSAIRAVEFPFSNFQFRVSEPGLGGHDESRSERSEHHRCR